MPLSSQPPSTSAIGTALVTKSMGRGMRLRIPHDDSGPRVVRDPDPRPQMQVHFSTMTEYAVSIEVVQQLLRAGTICKLNRDRTNNRAGWSECGMDGEITDWYALTQ